MKRTSTSSIRVQLAAITCWSCFFAMGINLQQFIENNIVHHFDCLITIAHCEFNVIKQKMTSMHYLICNSVIMAGSCILILGLQVLFIQKNFCSKYQARHYAPLKDHKNFLFFFHSNLRYPNSSKTNAKSA